uniref:Taraxerol synthase n=1 Tax=Rhizophora mucronata TaxID=61149 RepID=A0A2P2ML77_RHIMU
MAGQYRPSQRELRNALCSIQEYLPTVGSCCLPHTCIGPHIQGPLLGDGVDLAKEPMDTEDFNKRAAFIQDDAFDYCPDFLRSLCCLFKKIVKYRIHQYFYEIVKSTCL